MRAVIAAALLFAFAPLASAQQTDWLEGVHYDVVETEYDAPEDGSIDVVELFWYGCGACFQLEPHVERWLTTKPADVRFVRMPATIAQGWRAHARAYFTADALDVVDRVHGEIFRALHLRRQPLNEPAALADFFNEHAGVERESFQRAWDSFGVENRLRRADQFARRYRLTSTPSFVIAGKYVSAPSRVGSYEGMMALVDHLVALERGGPADPQAAPAQPAPAAEAETEAPTAVDEPAADERGPVPLWLWVLAALALVAVIVVALRRK